MFDLDFYARIPLRGIHPPLRQKEFANRPSDFAHVCFRHVWMFRGCHFYLRFGDLFGFYVSHLISSKVVCKRATIDFLLWWNL